MKSCFNLLKRAFHIYPHKNQALCHKLKLSNSSDSEVCSMALSDNKQWNTKGHSRCALSKSGSCHSHSFLTYIFFLIIPFKYKTGILWKRSVFKKLWHPGENCYCYNSSLFISSFSPSMCVSFVGVWVCSAPAYADIFMNICTFFYKIDISFYILYKI